VVERTHDILNPLTLSATAMVTAGVVPPWPETVTAAVRWT